MDLGALNAEQLEAVLHKDGPLLVFAGAGSGKTRVITYRIANLIYTHGVSPSQILAVTFTNKAADEMKERLQQLLGMDIRGLWVGTFHAICARILRESGRAIDIPPNFLVYDENDQLDLIRQVLSELDLDEKQFNPRAIRNAISRAKERLITPEQYAARASDFFERIVASVYPRYQKALQAANALDFDDLLLATIRLFTEQPRVLERYQQQFRYILVDEYQDVNYAQYVLVRMLAEAHGNLCVVGDDDQSIYRFRGAEPELILRFEKDFPNAKVVKLERNYRSTQPILDAAFHIIRQNKVRVPKRLWTERTHGTPVTLTPVSDEEEEARLVAEYIQRQVYLGRRRYGDFAILYRTNAQSRAFEERFLRERIPHRIVGALRFYDRKEIKDLIAYLRLVVNPDDAVSLRRIINTPPRKIGQQTLLAIQLHAAERVISPYRAMQDPDLLKLMPAQTVKAIQGFVELIEDLRAFAEREPLTPLVKRLIERTGYLAWLEERKDAESVDRAANVREFLNVVQRFEETAEETHGDASPMAFLQHVALVTDADMLGERGNQVLLMTLHTAKGLEFPVVFLVGLENGLLPHALSETPADIEEERRLCYVGMTRAIDELHLLFAQSRRYYGSRRWSEPSPFLRALKEVETPTLYQLMFRSAAEAASSSSPSASSGHAPAAQPLFLPGQRVRHPQYGFGVVVRATDHAITVMFPGGTGMLTFPASEAPLEVMR
ncbi:MAG: UvrD-helicase domain-containing protein [Armatimonadota bacterium]